MENEILLWKIIIRLKKHRCVSKDRKADLTSSCSERTEVMTSNKNVTCFLENTQTILLYGIIILTLKNICAASQPAWQEDPDSQAHAKPGPSQSSIMPPVQITIGRST